MIYLDNSAIQKPNIEVVKLVNDILTNQWGNASSVYEFGIESNRIVEHAKEIIANYLDCDKEELIMVGSGSEANSLAIDGWLYANNQDSFVTSVLEHPSILDNKHSHQLIHCDKNGFYNMNEIEDIKNSLVSLQMVNSEIGTIQDIRKITKILKSNGCTVHCDAVQALGKIKIDLKDLGIDMLSITAQKIGGILGSAVLYVKKGTLLSPIIYGKQNDGLRGSTYNVPAIAAFGKAIELINSNDVEHISSLRNYLWHKLILTFDNEIRFNGTNDFSRRLCNNLNIRINGVDNQQLIAMLSMSDICCSASSACCAGEKSPSKTLKAIGLSNKECNESLRISLSSENTYEELDTFVNILKQCVEFLK